MNLSDKIVVITGSGSGIGKSLAIGFSQDGAYVVGFGRTEQNLVETSRLCISGRMDYLVGDITSEKDVERLFSQTLDRLGKIDILINNAAVYPKFNFLDMPHTEWAKVIETNLIGVALCCRKALPGMLDRGYGRIINIGSFAGKAPLPSSSAYSVSKAGMMALTKALAVEIDRNLYPDVLINELVPGAIKTSMSQVGEDPMEVYPHARFLANLPVGGPHGQIFIKSQLYQEDYGIRSRIKRFISKFLAG